MTMTDPAGAVSTKCAESLGAVVSLPRTICTVYAGPQMRVSEPLAAGESMCMSGMCPPCGRPSLMSASESSQVEKDARAGVVEEDDMCI